VDIDTFDYPYPQHVQKMASNNDDAACSASASIEPPSKRSKGKDFDTKIDTAERAECKCDRNAELQRIAKRLRKEEKDAKRIRANTKSCVRSKQYIASFCDDPEDKATVSEWTELDALELSLIDKFAKTHQMEKHIDELGDWTGYEKSAGREKEEYETWYKRITELRQQIPSLGWRVMPRRWGFRFAVFFQRELSHGYNTQSVRKLLDRIKEERLARPPAMAVTP